MNSKSGFRETPSMKLINPKDSKVVRKVISERGYAEGVPLGKLIKREFKPGEEIVMLTRPRSLAAERFRRLKTTLVHRFGEGLQVIVVTSGAPEEGKSTVSTNLALAFAADSDRRTLLVDGDMRRPSLGVMLHPAPKVGLRDVLAGMAALDHGLMEVANTALDVLPAGDKVEDPLELLNRPEAAAMMPTLRDRYRWIVIDSPPIVPFTDADVLGALSDGVLMVVRAGHTPEAVFAQAVSAVTSTKVLGVVMNDSSKTLSDTGKYYDGYYDSYYDRKRKS